MDDQWMRGIEVEISKLNFLLENLYAISFNDHGETPEKVDEISEEMCRQALLPATSYGREVDAAALQEFQEMLAHRLAMFFARVRHRVAQERDG